jgi:hypothetical protein
MTELGGPECRKWVDICSVPKKVLLDETADHQKGGCGEENPASRDQQGGD